MEDQAHTAQFDDVAVAELPGSADPHAADERSVLAPQVADHAGVVRARNRRVMARHGLIVDGTAQTALASENRSPSANRSSTLCPASVATHTSSGGGGDERAVELDPLFVAGGHSSVGTVRAVFEWDWQESEREFRTAIRLSPSDVRAHHWLGLLLGTLGRYDESLEEMAIARELDPRSAEVVGSQGYIHRLRGDYARSIEDLRAALAMKPVLAPVRLDLAISLMMVGDYTTALRELQNVPGSDDQAATIRALAGDTESARRYLRGAETRPDAAQIGSGIASVHLALGDRVSALRWLHAAADVRSWPVTQVPREPYYARLYGDPEFDRLLRRLGLRQTRR